MKNLLLAALLLSTPQGNAQSLVSEEILEELPTSAKSTRKPIEDRNIRNTEPTTAKKRTPSNTIVSVPKAQTPSGNLPSYAIRSAPVDEHDVPTIIPKNTDFNTHTEVRPGDSLKAVISQNIVAYPGSKSPVTGRVLEGKFKGALVLGEATMDETTKRVNITFKSIRPLKSKDNYSLNGILLAEDGIQGLQGEYESSYWTYFWAETITNTVAGFADATTKKAQTIWGNSVPEPGIDSATRQGIAQGLAKTADRLGDRVKNAPEMTTVKGPTIVQITVIQ